MKSPLTRYRHLVETNALDADAAQAEAAELLQSLSAALTEKRSFFSWTPPKTPKGVYLWGGVGRGKSLLMDIFFNNTAVEKKRRVHFHEFMAEAHERIARWRAADHKARQRHPAYNRRTPDDPIPLVGYDLAASARLLCFDEFQVTDIADAMILGRLFGALFENGVVMVATSNRHPDDLYQNGINRQLFLPTIDLIKQRFEIFELAAERDYRLARLGGKPVYYSPLGPDAAAAMDEAWTRMICGATVHAEQLDVQGRKLEVTQAARDAARFEFDALCRRPLGASDYLALARRFGTIFIDNIPLMTPEDRDAAKRFVTLVDALYEARAKLVCSAAAEPNDLYKAGDGSFEFERTASRLIEMQSADYLGAERRSDIERNTSPD